MQRFKAQKVCFPAGLRMNGLHPINGIGKNLSVPSYEKCKNKQTLDSRNLLRLAASRP